MIKLNLFEKNDFDRLIRWIPNQHFMTQWSGTTFYYPLSKKQLNTYSKGSNRKKSEKYIFKSINSETKDVVGHVEIGYINYEKMEGSLCRVLIGEQKNHNQGMGLEMVKHSLNYAFTEIKLNTVILGVYDFNKSAIRCYEKAGFQTYEMKKKLPVPGNKCWNLICMSLKKENWLKNATI